MRTESRAAESSSMTYAPYGWVEEKWSSVSLRRRTQKYISIYAHVHMYNILDRKSKVITVSNMSACLGEHMAVHKGEFSLRFITP